MAASTRRSLQTSSSRQQSGQSSPEHLMTVAVLTVRVRLKKVAGATSGGFHGIAISNVAEQGAKCP